MQYYLPTTYYQGPIHDAPNDKFAAKSEQFCFTHNISLKDGILAICFEDLLILTDSHGCWETVFFCRCFPAIDENVRYLYICIHGEIQATWTVLAVVTRWRPGST